MTRPEKVAKLGNAIRDYRGAYHPASKVWIKPPQKHASERVKTCAERLRLDPVKILAQADTFKTYDEMRAWISIL